MDNLNQKTWILGAILLIFGGLAGYWIGGNQGFSRGYDKAIADSQSTQEAAAERAAAEAAKAANPFQATNPLEGVTTNPFEKAKKVLNPFE